MFTSSPINILQNFVDEDESDYEEYSDDEVSQVEAWNDTDSSQDQFELIQHPSSNSSSSNTSASTPIITNFLPGNFFENKFPQNINNFDNSKRINYKLSNLYKQDFSYLQPGLSFTGFQRQVEKDQNYSGKEEWQVKVVINSVNYEKGLVVGLMEAINAPVQSNTVITYWEGEIIDFKKNNLWTNKWKANYQTDFMHWRMFEPIGKLKLKKEFELQDVVETTSEIISNYIFMRWKDSGLTIAGFYYVCIRRIDGYIEGFYFDPDSQPYQKLTLVPEIQGNGLAFGNYSFQ